MIGVRAQSSTMFSEAGPKFTFSGSPICADQIYRTRSNRAFCTRHGIRLSGPRLGCPKRDPEFFAEDKRQFLDDQRQRNAVVAEGFCTAVGKIGQGKRRYGLGLTPNKLAVTQGSTIAMNLLVMNLEKQLELLFVRFACWLQLLLVSRVAKDCHSKLLGKQGAAA